MEPPQPLPVAFFLKRGTLIGAGLGMLAGLILLAIAGTGPDEEIASIVVWRNCILIGAAIGLFAGGALAWRLRCKENRRGRDENHEPTSKRTDP